MLQLQTYNLHHSPIQLQVFAQDALIQNEKEQYCAHEHLQTNKMYQKWTVYYIEMHYVWLGVNMIQNGELHKPEEYG